MEARISFTEDRSIQRIFPLNRVNYDFPPRFRSPIFSRETLEMERPVARSISTDRLIGLKKKSGEIDHRFFPFSFSFFEELQQGKRLSRSWEHGVQRFN